MVFNSICVCDSLNTYFSFQSELIVLWCRKCFISILTGWEQVDNADPIFNGSSKQDWRKRTVRRKYLTMICLAQVTYLYSLGTEFQGEQETRDETLSINSHRRWGQYRVKRRTKPLNVINTNEQGMLRVKRQESSLFVTQRADVTKLCWRPMSRDETRRGRRETGETFVTGIWTKHKAIQLRGR